MSPTYGERPDYSHGHCFTARASGLVLFLWVAASFTALHKCFTCCGADVLIGRSQMLSGGWTNFMALRYSVITTD